MIVAKTIVQRIGELTIVCTSPGCGRTLDVHSALVGDLTNTYLGARQGPVESLEPLTASELAGEARCSSHPLAAGRMYPIAATAALMDRWIAANARAQQLRPVEHRERGKHTSRRLFIELPPPPTPDKPNPKHRTRSHEPRHKRTEAPSTVSKKKQKQDEAAKRKQARQH